MIGRGAVVLIALLTAVPALGQSGNPRPRPPFDALTPRDHLTMPPNGRRSLVFDRQVTIIQIDLPDLVDAAAGPNNTVILTSGINQGATRVLIRGKQSEVGRDELIFDGMVIVGSQVEIIGRERRQYDCAPVCFPAWRPPEREPDQIIENRNR